MRIRGTEELRKEMATSTIPGLDPPDGRIENPDAIFDLDEVGIEYGAVRTITQIGQNTLVRPQADIRIGLPATMSRTVRVRWAAKIA